MAFVALGMAILFGYRPRFATPHIDRGGRTRSVGSMFVYGVAYAVASLGCTIADLPHRRHPAGAARRVPRPASSTSCATPSGWRLVVVALTVSLALASQTLLRSLRTVMRHVDQLAGAFMVLSGVYLIYYFLVVDLGDIGASDPIVDAVTRWQDPHHERADRPLAVGRRRAGRDRRRRVPVRLAARRPSVQSPSGEG